MKFLITFSFIWLILQLNVLSITKEELADKISISRYWFNYKKSFNESISSFNTVHAATWKREQDSKILDQINLDPSFYLKKLDLIRDNNLVMKGFYPGMPMIDAIGTAVHLPNDKYRVKIRVQHSGGSLRNAIKSEGKVRLVELYHTLQGRYYTMLSMCDEEDKKLPPLIDKIPLNKYQDWANSVPSPVSIRESPKKIDGKVSLMYFGSGLKVKEFFGFEDRHLANLNLIELLSSKYKLKFKSNNSPLKPGERKDTQEKLKLYFTAISEDKHCILQARYKQKEEFVNRIGWVYSPEFYELSIYNTPFVNNKIDIKRDIKAFD